MDRVQLILHFIQTHTTEYWIMNETELAEAREAYSEGFETYEWYFYNPDALDAFLGDYLVPLDGVPASNIKRMNGHYLKQ